jgi:hypothetical protein
MRTASIRSGRARGLAGELAEISSCFAAGCAPGWDPRFPYSVFGPSATVRSLKIARFIEGDCSKTRAYERVR